MMNVANRKTIRRLAWKSMAASRSRNLIAVLAIALTTVLFTALFTIALSINEGIQQANFRQAGGWSHGGFKYLTEEQFEELRDDPRIEEWGLRRFLGMPTEAPFDKSHVEIGYSDANQAHWMYCDPVEGRLPEESTNEAATDTRALELLGVEPVLGTEFTVTFDVDGHETTQTFTLCGWWEYDEAVFAHHILIPESRVDAVLQEVGVTPPGSDGMTGTWNLDVMFQNSLHIERNLKEILEAHGYQAESPSEEGNYISIGVNWGYSGAQIADSVDPITILAIVVVLLLIVFTGYLIIYNVFQISVAGDVQYYGLLKTIGTTPRQVRRILRIQALLLSAVGIPAGMVLGWLVGSVLTPVVTARLSGVVSIVSVSPLLFAVSAAFSLITVLISCRKPGRMAGKVSPVEAVRYTESGGQPRKLRRRGGQKGASLPAMARANLGRSRKKTVITVLSLTLAVVLMNITVTFTSGFDMEKYVSNFMASDFLVADGGQFQTGGDLFHRDMAVPEDVIDTILARDGITGSGRIYGRTSAVQEFVTEDYYRSMHGHWSTQEQLDSLVHFTNRNEQGLLEDTAQLYGMESFALDHLEVLEGDITKLYAPGSRYIAAVYSDDDYGNAVPDSHWAQVGDTVTLRYVEKFEYYNPDTGEVYEAGTDLSNLPVAARAAAYRDVDYTVAAKVVVPYAFSYRYYGSDEFILNDQTFVEDSGTDSVMYFAFDTTEETSGAMETFLQDYTETVNSQLDYESKSTFAAEFESTRMMFLMLGGTLSAIVGLVGILNFFNAVLTGILTRRREFAVLQAVGMTGKQLEGMLILEGLLYTMAAAAASLVLSLVLSPLAGRAIGSVLWFYTYHFTVMPVLIITPIFAVLGICIPLLAYGAIARRTVVERLREVG